MTAIDVNDYEAMLEAQLKVRDELSRYDGDFSFLLDMKALAADPDYNFTPKQIEACLRSLIRHHQAQANPPKQVIVEPLLDPKKMPLGTTRHAVENADGKLTFIRIDNVEKGKWEGWIFVKGISGPEEFRVGAQKPNGEYKGQWQPLLEKVNADPLASIARYGKEIGKCGICGLRLTDELSRERGIGPICWDKWGV